MAQTNHKVRGSGSIPQVGTVGRMTSNFVICTVLSMVFLPNVLCTQSSSLDIQNGIEPTQSHNPSLSSTLEDLLCQLVSVLKSFLSQLLSFLTQQKDTISSSKTIAKEDSSKTIVPEAKQDSSKVFVSVAKEESPISISAEGKKDSSKSIAPLANGESSKSIVPPEKGAPSKSAVHTGKDDISPADPMVLERRGDSIKSVVPAKNSQDVKQKKDVEADAGDYFSASNNPAKPPPGR